MTFRETEEVGKAPDLSQRQPARIWKLRVLHTIKLQCGVNALHISEDVA